MKKDTHPANNRLVIFEDASSGARFLLYSTVATTEKGKWDDGKEYDLMRTEVSSASHPFFTGKDIQLDTAGRAEKFRQKVAAAKPTKETSSKKAEEKKEEESAPVKEEA